MANIFTQLKIQVLGATRLAPGVWKVAHASWGAVHDFRLAKLCALGWFAQAEKRAMARLARATRPGAFQEDLAVALHDLACVFQAQGKFVDAIKAREQFRLVAREVIGTRFPGILAFSDEMRKQTHGLRWPCPEWHRALLELASAEESLIDAYVEERRLVEALRAADYAIAVRRGIGDESGAESIRRSRVVVGRMAAELQGAPSLLPAHSLGS